MAKVKPMTGRTRAGNSKSGTSNYLRRTDYSVLDEAGNTNGRKKTKKKGNTRRKKKK